MNTNGIGSALNQIRLPLARPQVEQQRAPHTTPDAAPVAPVSVPQGIAPKPDALPVEAPPGTDPELWSVLTADERAFFAKVGAMGPLTYGRMLSPGAAPVSRGGRLDVRA